jgi:excisionase family DNA binding protein
MNLKTLTVRQAHDATGIPIITLRKLLESGQVAGNRVGAKWFVSEASLHAWINRVPEAPARSDEKVFPEVGEDRFA